MPDTLVLCQFSRVRNRVENALALGTVECLCEMQAETNRFCSTCMMHTNSNPWDHEGHCM